MNIVYKEWRAILEGYRIGPLFPERVDELGHLWSRFVERYEGRYTSEFLRRVGYAIVGERGRLEPDDAFIIYNKMSRVQTSDRSNWVGLHFTIGGRVRVAVLFPSDPAKAVGFYADPVDEAAWRGDYASKLPRYLEGFCGLVIMTMKEFMSSPEGVGQNNPDDR